MLKAIGSSVIATAAVSQSALAKDDGGVNQYSVRTENGTHEVLYEGERGKIIKVGSHSYVIDGANSKEDYEYLEDKRYEILSNDGGGVETLSTANDLGTDEDNGFYRDREYVVSSKFEATVDDGSGECSGEASASWYGDAYWHDDPVNVEEIGITSRIICEFEELSSAAVISRPPAYEIIREGATSEIELSETFDSNSIVSLHHSEGTITFDGGSNSCIKSMAQDDSFRFKFEGGNTRYAGTYIKADVDNCSSGWFPWPF